MKILEAQECRVETTTDGKTIVYLYGGKSSACETYIIGGNLNENKCK